MPGFTILIAASGEETLDLADHYQPAPGAGPVRSAATAYAAQQLAAQFPPQHPDALWGITQTAPGELSVQEVLRIPGITVDPFSDDALFALGQLLVLGELHRCGEVPPEIHASAQELGAACGYGPTETAIAAAYLGTHRMTAADIDALVENPQQLLRLAQILRAGWEHFDPGLRLDATGDERTTMPSTRNQPSTSTEPAGTDNSTDPAGALTFLPPSQARAYTAGAAAGEQIGDQLRDSPAITLRTATFWLNTGKVLEHVFPDADSATVTQFVRGAQSRYPTELRPAALVTIPRLSLLRPAGTAHPPTDAPSTDGQSTTTATTATTATEDPAGAREQIASLLEQAGDRIRSGHSGGVLRTATGQPVGTFDVHVNDQETR